MVDYATHRSGIKNFRAKYALSKSNFEAVVFLTLFFAFFGYLGHVMGVTNMLNTIMQTAWDLLLNTVFYIMGITVLSGALSRLLLEFGVVSILEKILSPLMRPLFRLPGVAAIAGLLTFFSDNPAIISFANDKKFSKYFEKHELISLTNFGTAFGMGLIVITFMSSLQIGGGEAGSCFIPALIGLAGAIFGSIVSTRLMQKLIKKTFENDKKDVEDEKDLFIEPTKEEEGVFLRFMNSILDGGKSGVDLGLSIIPGVLIISSLVMIVTFEAKDPTIGYQGLAYEGVPIIPRLASHVDWLFLYLFGFKDTELIAFPMTSLGSVGASLSLVKAFIVKNILDGNAIAVFTAMGMCWSGYMSTHAAMLDSLNYRKLTSKALISHTIGGLAAGCFAHYLYVLVSYILATYTTVIIP